MTSQSMGFIGTSRKENERRVPIHLDHLSRLPESIRRNLIFEEGYGAAFGITDSEIAARTGGVASRKHILDDASTVVILKPELADLLQLREGGTLWGYPHCVQNHELTQVAIDRKQTLIAFEDMFIWGPKGQIGRHTFYKNNELAGYCAVLHALQLKGIDGHYGNQRKTTIFSFGAVSRGAIYALKARGFRDITICIQRPDYEVREEVLDCHYARIIKGQDNQERLMLVEHDGTERSFFELIQESDIIVNGTYQDPNDPFHFITESEKSYLKPGSLIVDVSCDENMGFYFAKPTTFANPIFKVNGVDYYAVDHTPSYLWESASRAISAALIVYLPTVMEGRDSWNDNETIKKAINIEGGVIQKPHILSFQNRQTGYPHEDK